MIKRRSMIMFLFAIILAAGAAWIANNWLKIRMTPTAEAAATPVVVAALRIPYGQKIEGIHVKTINMPNGTAPAGTFTKTDQVMGKIANQTIYPGEFLINERIVDQLGGSTLSALVTPQKRAVTVRVNEVIGVAGFLLPGNRVDVVATVQEDRRAIARTILEDLKVLAVDQTASPEKEQPIVVRAVTLEMTPQQAETLVKATTEGTVQLTLRNPGDTSIVMQTKEEPKPVVAKPAPRPRAVAVAPRPSVTIIRGTQESKASL